jgi:hypothetical protein
MELAAPGWIALLPTVEGACRGYTRIHLLCPQAEDCKENRLKLESAAKGR